MDKMQIRQWMVPHEWMTKHTPQTEWIERRGILVWIAEVFTSLGAGLYLVSLFFNNLWGMLIAWLIILILKIPLHIIYFGKPLRFWRTIPPFTNAWKTSWFTRGIAFTILFTGFAFIQLVFSFWLPGTGWDIAFKVMAGTTAFLVGIYSGFIMSYCKSLPFWNSAVLPLVFIFAGIADGFALMMAIGLWGGQANIIAIETGSRIVLTINAVIIATYIWNATYISGTAKYSSVLLLRGSLALPFWLGVVVLGIVMPLGISGFSYFAGEVSAPLLIIAILLHTLGAFALKYTLLKAGIHKPLVPVITTSYH
jgi:formate-dependent nitrite reductase membrane component NrfD